MQGFRNKAAELNIKILALVKQERKITYEILALISQMERTRSYAELGFSSMFDYLIKGCGYSESSAYRRLNSSRLLRQAPQLAEKVQTGKSNLTQASLLQTAIRQEEKKSGNSLTMEKKLDLASKVEERSTFETKSLLLQELPHYEWKSSYLEPQRTAEGCEQKIKLVMEISQSELEQLCEVQDLLSQALPSRDLKDLLMHLCAKALKQKSASKPKPESPQKTDMKQSATGAEVMKRKAIPLSLRKRLLAQAHYRCQYRSKLTNKICGARNFLQIDHIRPVAMNGSNDISNLRVYCRTHNFLAAQKSGLMSG